MNYFTTYWRNSTWAYNQMSDDSLLDHTASENFRKRVKKGDAIYILTVKKGTLFVACKIIVAEIVDRAKAVVTLGTSDLWDATDHILASESTKIDWNRPIPDRIVRKLEFLDGKGNVKKLAYTSPGVLDKQAFRGTRMLAPQSVLQLDNLLGDLFPIPAKQSSKKSLWVDATEPDSPEAEFESKMEGDPKKRYTTYYERKNRAAAIRIHGLTCQACDMNFEETYGDHGKGFIHVHHLVPIHQYETPRKPNIAKEMGVLCPNCHAMVHKQRDKTLSIEEVRRLINAARTRKA